jgi:hypothetical protein
VVDTTTKPLEVTLREDAGIDCVKLVDHNRTVVALKGPGGTLAYWITLGGEKRESMTIFGRVPIAMSDKWANTHNGHVEGIQQLDAVDYKNNIYSHRVYGGVDTLLAIAADLKAAGLVNEFKTGDSLHEIIAMILLAIPDTQQWRILRNKLGRMKNELSSDTEQNRQLVRDIVIADLAEADGIWKDRVISLLPKPTVQPA